LNPLKFNHTARDERLLIVSGASKKLRCRYHYARQRARAAGRHVPMLIPARKSHHLRVTI
jgi:hypothetical protein